MQMGNSKSRGLDQLDAVLTYVQRSRTFLLIHGNAKLVGPQNALECVQLDQLQRREHAAAKQSGSQLLRVYDSDAAVRQPNDSTDIRKLLSPFDPELDEALLEWPNGEDYQLATLAQIAEHVLLSSPGYDRFASLPLYVETGLRWSQVEFPRDVAIYVSPNNTAADRVALELSEEFPSLRITDRRTLGRRSRARWLLFLSASTFEDGRGESLEFELVTALKAGVQPLILYSPEANAFSDVVEGLPSEIVSAGLFGPRTIEWREGSLNRVSVRQVARALGARLRPAVPEEPHGWIKILSERILAVARGYSQQERPSATFFVSRDTSRSDVDVARESGRNGVGAEDSKQAGQGVELRSLRSQSGVGKFKD